MKHLEMRIVFSTLFSVFFSSGDETLHPVLNMLRQNVADRN